MSPESHNIQFIIKASRRITHIGRLKNIDEALGYLVQRVDLLGDKLGAVLFQMPPNAALNRERLTTIQAKLPETLPVAFEFRHPSNGRLIVLGNGASVRLWTCPLPVVGSFTDSTWRMSVRPRRDYRL